MQLYLQLFCALNVTGLILKCSDQQQKMNGMCCNKCPAGHYLDQTCTSTRQTLCKPCPDGHFSDSPSVFDRCEECDSCERDYAQKCTPTTNAKCSCGSGFLCSDNFCFTCEKDNCVRGEKHKRTDIVDVAKNRTKYTYKCEPLCADHKYIDEKKNVCIPIIQCSALGLVEIFAGNKTHNAICQSHEIQMLYMVVMSGFVFLLVTIVVVFSYHSAKRMKKKPNDSKAIKVTTPELCPLSMEETTIPENKVESFVW
ncbi:tumor necrosis factor receptor superfamily member 18 [Eucyclogobius newberryi]|uniref:tumor necrosis factor receptor superfamily member 18 n=1 Tax=Eucyclogobius newberryi TaxID=166745 RepID=UPI003B59783A